MDRSIILINFMAAAEADARICAVHISIFLVLFGIWREQSYCNPFFAFSRDVMSKAKVSGRATYFRCLNDLHHFGYLQYEASTNYQKGSRFIFSGAAMHEGADEQPVRIF